MTYNMLQESVSNFGAALRFHLVQKQGALITIFAETRAEWMISCLGAFSQVDKKCVLKFEKVHNYTNFRIAILFS